jgi:hypothetical protein
LLGFFLKIQERGCKIEKSTKILKVPQKKLSEFQIFEKL